MTTAERILDLLRADGGSTTVELHHDLLYLPNPNGKVTATEAEIEAVLIELRERGEAIERADGWWRIPEVELKEEQAGLFDA